MDGRRFRRDFSSLEPLFEFVAEFVTASDLGPSHAFNIDLVVEELFTNMVKYSKDGVGEIEVGLERTDAGLVIRLRDFDVDAFDLTKAPAADTNKPVAQRTRGGMGLHLIRQIAETVRYDYADRTSTITVTLRLEN